MTEEEFDGLQPGDVIKYRILHAIYVVVPDPVREYNDTRPYRHAVEFLYQEPTEDKSFAQPEHVLFAWSHHNFDLIYTARGLHIKVG